MDEIFEKWEKEERPSLSHDFFRNYDEVLEFAEYYHNHKLNESKS